MPSRSCFEQHNAEEMVSSQEEVVELLRQRIWRLVCVCLGVAVAGPVLISSLQS